MNNNYASKLLRAALRGLARSALGVWIFLGAFAPAVQAQSVLLPNAEYTESMVDLRVKVLGGRLDFTRTWTNGRWYMNPSWATLEFVLDPLDQSVKSIARAGASYARSGTTDVYIFDGVFSAQVFIRKTATGWRWYDRAGNSITYDPSGRITSYQDPNGVKTTFVIDAQGQRTAVKDHFGNIVATFSYQDDKLTAIRDYTGRQVSYGWDGNKLLRVTNVRAEQWFYSYDTNGQLVKRTSPTGAITLVSYSASVRAGPTAMDSGKTAGQGLASSGVVSTNASTTSAVNYAGRVGKMVDPMGRTTLWNTAYDKSTGKYTVTTDMPDGQIVEQVFDREGRQLSRSVNGTVRTKLARDGKYTEMTTDERGLVTTDLYDVNRNLVQRTFADGSALKYEYDSLTGRELSRTNELGIVTRQLYDPQGNRTQLTEAAGTANERVTKWTYDAYGQPLTRTLVRDGTPLVQTMAYDTQGNQVTYKDEEGKLWQYTHNVRGQVVSAKNPLGHTWLSEYDAAGNQTKATDPLGNSTTYAVDAEGRVTEIKDALGNRTRITYNASGQLLKVVDALNGETKWDYNAKGRLWQQTSPAGLSVVRDYQSDGRLFRLYDPVGNTMTLEYENIANGLRGVLTAVTYPTYREEYRYDQRNRRTLVIRKLDAQTQLNTRMGYDAAGRVISQTAPDGATTLQQYDALGQATQRTDPLGGTTRQQFDISGNLIALTDPSGSTHRFTYDKVGRLVREERPGGGATTLAYDAAGQLTRRTQPAGNREDYQYDAAGRLQRIAYTPAGQASPSHTTEITLDAAGWVQERSTSASATIPASPAILQRYTRDALGRVTQEQTTYGSGPSAIQASLSTSYNPDGATTGITYPDGSSTSYAYHRGQLQSATTPTGQSIQWSAYTWGQPTQASYPGVNRSQSYDPLMRPLATNLTPAAAPALMTRTLQYDSAGNITQRSTEAGDFAYTYDKAGHLTSATPPAALQASLPVEAYTYDPSGNRTSSTHQPGAWAYNPEHQLLQWGNAANQVSLRYNPNGHLQTQTVGGQTRTHSYDAADRLVEVKDNLGNSAQYSYDPQGRRIRKTTPAKTTWYLYSPQGLIAELSDTGKVEKAYGWEPDQAWGTAPLWQATTSNGQLNNAATADYHYLHTDHLGTVQMATDSNGNISWKGQAQAFGKVELDPTNRITMNLRLPGQYYDQETGTHYNWMRDYGASTGRYIQRDPIGLEAGFNPYLYVDANPLSFIDPEGLAKFGGPAKGERGELAHLLERISHTNI